MAFLESDEKMSKNGSSNFHAGGFIRTSGQPLLPLPNAGLAFPPALMAQGNFPLPSGLPNIPAFINIPAAPSQNILPVPPVPLLSSHSSTLADSPSLHTDPNTVFVNATIPPPLLSSNIPNFPPPVSSLPTSTSVSAPPLPPQAVAGNSDASTPTSTVQVQASALEKAVASKTASDEASNLKDAPAAAEKSSKDEKAASAAKPKMGPAVGPKPLLGKLEAKKRLQAFSGRTSFALNKPGKSVAKNALNEGEEEDSGKAPDDAGSSAESKKPQTSKKKKKEEKVSVIEQIRVEESRIREALGVHGMHFNPYTPQFAAFLDNPESLKRLEEKGKDYIEKLEKRRQDEERREQEKKDRKEREKKERELERIRKKEKEKERIKYEKEREARKAKEKELRANKEAESAEAKASRSSRTSAASGRSEKRDHSGSRVGRERLRVPRDWDEFRKLSVPWDEYKRFVRGSKEIQRDRKLIEDINVLCKDSDDTVLFPGRSVQHTRTKPSICFSENPGTYKELYMTRRAARSSLPSEELEIVEKVWNAQYLQCPDTLPEDILEFSQMFWFDENWFSGSSERLSRQSLSQVPSKWDSDDENTTGIDKECASDTKTTKVDFFVNSEDGNNTESEEKDSDIPREDDMTLKVAIASREERDEDTKSKVVIAADASSHDGASTRDQGEAGMVGEYEAFIKMVGSEPSERREDGSPPPAPGAQQDVLGDRGRESDQHLLEKDKSDAENQSSAAELKKVKKQQKKEKKKIKKAARKLRKALKKSQKKAEKKKKKALQAELEKDQADKGKEEIEAPAETCVGENMMPSTEENKPESVLDEYTNSSAGISTDGSTQSSVSSPQPYSPSSAYSSISSPGSSCCSPDLSPSAADNECYTPPPLPPKVDAQPPTPPFSLSQLPPLPPSTCVPPLAPPPALPVPSPAPSLPPLPPTPGATQLPPLPETSGSDFPGLPISSPSNSFSSSCFSIPPPSFSSAPPPLPHLPPSTSLKPLLPCIVASIPPPPIPTITPSSITASPPKSSSLPSPLAFSTPSSLSPFAVSSVESVSSTYGPGHVFSGMVKQDVSTVCVPPPLPPCPAQGALSVSRRMSREFPDNQSTNSQTLDIPMPSVSSDCPSLPGTAPLLSMPKVADSTPGSADETKLSSQDATKKTQSLRGESLSPVCGISDRKEIKGSTVGSKETRSIVFKLDSMKTSSKILRKSALSGFDDDDPKSTKLPTLSFEALERYREAKIAKSSASELESCATGQETTPGGNRETSEPQSGFTVVSFSQDLGKTEVLNNSSENKSVAPAQSKLEEKDVDGEGSSNESNQLSDTPQRASAIHQTSLSDHNQDPQKDDLPQDERSKYFLPVRPDGSQECLMPEKSSEIKEGESLERKHEMSPEPKKNRSPDCRRDRSPDRKRDRSPDRKLDRSPDRKLDRSPDRKLDRSPDRKLDRSPDRKLDRSPDRKRDRSPDRKRDRSPDRKRDRSPDRKRARSPDRKWDRSPDRKRDRSPESKRDRSPDRKRKRSPDRKRERSPDRRREKSPDRRREKSPDRRREKSPDRRREKSPDRRREKSPDRRREKSPDRRREKSPERRREKSPDRRREKSPDRRREKSPDRRREKSPDRRRERSPDRRRDKSPDRRREKSPDRRREKSPDRRRIRSPDRQQDRSRDRSPISRQEDSRDRSPRSSRRVHGDSKDRLRSPDRRNNREFASDRQMRGRSSSPSRDQNRRSLDQWQSDGRTDYSRDQSVDSRSERSIDGSKSASPSRGAVQESSPKKIPSIVQLQYSVKSTEFMSEEEHRPEWNYDPAELDEPLLQEWQTRNQASSNNVLIDTSLAGHNVSLPTEAPPPPIVPVTTTPSAIEQTENQDSNAGGDFTPSPPCSPERRLSLDDRLAKEHGLVIHDEPGPPPVQGDATNAAWKAPAFTAPSVTTTASNAIQVGNMLQILPQEIPTPVGPPPTSSLPPKPDLSSESVNLLTRLTDELRAGVGAKDPARGKPGSSDRPSADSATSTANILPLIVAGAAAAAASGSSTSPNAVAQLISLLQQTANRAPTSTTDAAAAPPPPPPPPPLPLAEPTEEMKQLQQEELLKQQQQQELLKQQQQHARKLRKERREKRRLEREARRAARRSAEEQKTAGGRQQDSDDDDEATIREAISEEPNLGSPVAEYELEAEAEEAHAASLRQAEEAMELRLKKYMPAPTPDRGILMSPNYRIHGGSSCKSVKFADGVLPGEGTSPSGGEEIHSPPPPLADDQEDGSGASAARPPREKKLRKKNKPRTRAIKLFEGVSEADVLSSSPPPPPASPPPGCTPIFLYPGYSHFTLSEPGTAVLYTNPQPPTSAPHTPNGLPPQGARYDISDGSSPFVGTYDGNTVGLPPFPAMNGSPFPVPEGGSPFVSQSASLYDPSADR